jgi:hypothetical protein
MFALVCLDWNGHEIYTSFYQKEQEAVLAAERLPSVIRVEVAHSKKSPVWVRDRLTPETNHCKV